MEQTLEELYEFYMDARRDGFLVMKELKQQGEKICGAFCDYTPGEIVEAAGIYQVGLCGGSPDAIPRAEQDLPANLCPMIKASYGHMARGSCPYAFFSDLVVGETTCDGKKKAYELMGKIKPMHVLHLPNVPDRERSIAMWTAELRRFRDRLEDYFGVQVTDEALNRVIREKNRIRKQFVRIYELGKKEPPAITGTNMLRVATGGRSILDQQKKYDMLRHLADLCEEAWERGEGPWKPDPLRPRVMISGTSSDDVLSKVVPVLEEAGAAVVCFEGCGGVASFRDLVDEDPSRDPYLRLAEKYLDLPCAVMCPNDRRMNQVCEIIREWRVDGVVNVNMHSCTPYAIEAEHVRRVSQELGVPAIHIQSDYSRADESQLRIRLEAFVEMLRAAKAEQAQQP